MRRWRVLVAACMIAGVVQAEDVTTRTGATYKKARVSQIRPDAITILHEGGIANIPLRELTDAQKEKYGLSEKKLKEAEVQAAAPGEATVSGVLCDNNSYGFGGSSYSIGGTTYYNNNRGSDGTSYSLGNTTYHDFGNGQRGSSYTVGSTTYHDLGNGRSGSSYTVGNTTYHDLGNGKRGTSYTVGNTTYYSE